MRSILTGAILTVIAGCGSAPQLSDTSNEFGSSNSLIEVTNPAYPWNTIGRLDSGCTGALIGKRLILTSAHCLVTKEGGRVKPTIRYFRPGYTKGKSKDKFALRRFWYGGDDFDEDRTHDWAIAELHQPVGEAYDWLDVLGSDLTAQLPYMANLAGYSASKDGGNSAWADLDCFITKKVEGRFLHACSTSSGTSGAPLFRVIDERVRVVGVHVSELRQGASSSVKRLTYSDDYANIAVPATQFASVAHELQRTIDRGEEPVGLDKIPMLRNPYDPANETVEALPQPGTEKAEANEAKQSQTGSESNTAEVRETKPAQTNPAQTTSQTQQATTVAQTTYVRWDQALYIEQVADTLTWHADTLRQQAAFNGHADLADLSLKTALASQNVSYLALTLRTGGITESFSQPYFAQRLANLQKATLDLTQYIDRLVEPYRTQLMGKKNIILRSLRALETTMVIHQ